ncbi:hypothetical protein [Micromonospora sp. NBC_01796]|uniref:hypothetical protein n=1 Tax=Micromonospora sp. NBC_01796 TaxID=2975987 RepID=UPI002DDB6F08|nr:hypothetical protein [Micromonospora sp. NBC_01796]WSA86850.1 hypothetical protein OIE47_04285 [Micromonospora sp. NBC_01796]
MSQPLNGPDDAPLVDPTTPLPPVTGSGAAPVPAAGPAGAGNPPPATAGQPTEPPTVAHPAPAVPGQPAEPPTVAHPAPTGPGVPPPYYAPVSGVPASGVPVGGPQPYPGVPMSGAPYGQPMSAPPGPGLPYGTPAPGGKRRTVLVLSIVVALLFTVGAVMTGLFVTRSNELNRTERELTGQVADRDTRLAANSREIERLNRGLEAANDRIKAVEQDLTGTKNDRDEQARQKAVIANCLDLFSKAMTASSESAFKKALEEADKVCAEADGYL